MSASAAHLDTVFVYGTLLAPEVTKLVLNRVPAVEPARLVGYRRYSIKGRMYPALAKATDSDTTEGKVLHAITPHELDILDEYEDDEYYKDIVQVETASGQNVRAHVYIWQDHLRYKLAGSWSYDVFREYDMAQYLRIHAPFAEEVKEAVPKLKTNAAKHQHVIAGADLQRVRSDRSCQTPAGTPQ